jgi:hypothetical protein
MWHAWERGETCTGFGGKARRKKTLERPRSRWEDGIKVDHREIGWEGVEWIHLA